MEGVDSSETHVFGVFTQRAKPNSIVRVPIIPMSLSIDDSSNLANPQ